MSGLINPYGTPARVIQAVLARHVTAVTCQHLLDELATVLAARFRRWIALADAVASVDALGREADVRPDPAAVPRHVRDPDDDYLVALSDAAAAVIVTGDADLLAADSRRQRSLLASCSIDLAGHEQARAHSCTPIGERDALPTPAECRGDTP